MVHFVVPAFNEEKNISALIEEIHGFVSPRYPYRLTVVDDGSIDRTAEIVGALSKVYPCEVVGYKPNRGVHEAFRLGLGRALEAAGTGDVIVTLEADRTSDITLLPLFLSKLEAGCDLVVASYYVEGGAVEGTAWHRKVLSRGANFLIRSLLGVREVHTYSSFYRAYRPDVLRRVVERYGDFFEEKGFSCVVELLVRIHRLKASIQEVPMVLRGEKRVGKSKMKVLKTIAGYLRMIRRNAFA